MLLFCVDNIVKLLLKIYIFDIKAVLIANVCGCVISGVLFVIIAVFVFLFLLFLPLLFLLSFVLLCSLLIL